jgi:hypothetical protein
MDKRNPSASITPVVKRRTQPSVDKYIEATGSALVEHGNVAIDPEEMIAAMKESMGEAAFKAAMKKAKRIIAKSRKDVNRDR